MSIKYFILRDNIRDNQSNVILELQRTILEKIIVKKYKIKQYDWNKGM